MLWRINSEKYQCYLELFSPLYHFLDKLSLYRFCISAKMLFFASKLNENYRSLALMKCLIFILGWSSYFLIALKTGSVKSDLAILLARGSPISKFSIILLKFVFKISASSSLLLIVLLILFKIMGSLWKCLLREERTDSLPNFSIVGDNFMV